MEVCITTLRNQLCKGLFQQGELCNTVCRRQEGVAQVPATLIGSRGLNKAILVLGASRGGGRLPPRIAAANKKPRSFWLRGGSPNSLGGYAAAEVCPFRANTRLASSGVSIVLAHCKHCR